MPQVRASKQALPGIRSTRQEITMKIGVIGLGRMGAALATRLQSCGHELVVWNRTPEKARPLVEAGAGLADSPAEVVSRSEVVITCLLDVNALDEVFSGDSGILSGNLSGKLLIEM